MWRVSWWSGINGSGEFGYDYCECSFLRWLLKKFLSQTIHQWSKMRFLPTGWVSFQLVLIQGFSIICQVCHRYICWFSIYFMTNSKFYSYVPVNPAFIWFSILTVENDTSNEKNTIVFKLHVRCERGGPRLTGMCAAVAVNWLFGPFCFNWIL